MSDSDERNEHFQRLADILPDGLLISQAGTCVYANPAAAMILGAPSPGQLIGTYPLDLIHPDDRPLFTARCASMQQNKPAPAQEMRALTLDGRTIHIESTAMLYEGPIGSSVLIVLRDLTVRKQLEAAQRTGDEQFRILVEGIKDYAIILLDPEGRVTTWNAGAERIIGYATEDIIGQPIDAFHTADDRESRHPMWLLQQAAAKGSVSDEGWRVRKDGSSFWATIVLTALYDERGQVRGFIKVTRDVTERKLTEDMVAQSERRFRLLIESAGSVIVRLSTDGKILAWNRAAEDLSGWSRNQVSGQDFVAFCLPLHVKHLVQADILKALEGESVRGAEYPFLTQQGIQRICSWNIDRLLDDSGKPVGLIAVGHDVTEQKQAEAKLRRLNERLAVAASDLEQVREQEQRRIARDIHDELGHQLTAAKLEASFLAELVQSGNQSDWSKAAGVLPRLRRHLDDMVTTVRSIARRIRPDLLDRLGLIPALEALVADFKQQTGLDARFICDPAAGTIDNDVERTTLYRVAQEALTNVARHAQATALEVRLRETDGEWRLDIEDNGKGFDASRAARSLGLRGMHERVEMIHGSLSISSREGLGTTVTVRTQKRVPAQC